MSEKIADHHLRRKAILYVRQSSAYQVAHNEESRRLQYAMQDRLRELGWQEVEVVDEDLGRSAAGTVARSGFERMVADVCLGKVGAVAAREVSRFARNSREWQQLVEVCRLVDTLLIDLDVVYAPRLCNDRLLLGLKGSLNEYELDLLRQRSLEARYEKARRGELVVAAPVGFLKTDDQRLEMDPDRRVQERIRLMFRKFLELGSIRQTLMWFLEADLQVPARMSDGNLVWKRPRYSAIQSVLTGPIYAGAYVFGRTEHGSRFEEGRQRKVVRRRSREEWISLIPDHHDGYISWDQFERVQEMITANCLGADQPGAAKRGSALLSGILRCRRCGRKMTVNYTGNRRCFLRYACVRGQLDCGEAKCISFGGVPVDEQISREVLKVVQPASIEAAVQAGQEAASRQDSVFESLQHDLEAARYASTRARKQYDAADPENRLVTDELERRWNTALEREQTLQRRIEHHQSRRQEASDLTVSDFLELAGDLEAVWNDPESDAALKKRIVRTLIHEVIASVDDETNEVVLVIHWKGGVHTELRIPRRKRGTATRTDTDVIEAVRTLARICRDRQIAGYLNRNGLKTGRGNRWTQQRVTALRTYHRIPVYSQEDREHQGGMNLTEAATFLELSSRTVRLAAERQEIPGQHPLPDGPWIFRRHDLESEAARKLVQRTRPRGHNPAVPADNQQSLDFSGT